MTYGLQRNLDSQTETANEQAARGKPPDCKAQADPLSVCELPACDAEKGVMGKIHLPDNKAGRRKLKSIQKKTQTRKISSELGVTEAWVKKQERRLDKLENADTGRDKRLNLMWQWANDIWRREGRK